MAEILQTAIIGCGAVAGGYDEAHDGDAMVLSHAGAYSRHDGFALSVCVEPDAARRGAFMQRWGIAQGFATIAEWRQSGVACDVASLCTPSADHAGMLEELLSLPLRGVFCEKPVATDLADGQAVVARYKSAGRALQVNYSRRWDPAMAELKQALADGAWGAVYGASGFYSKGLLNNGSHLIDLVSWLLGPAELSAVTRRRTETDDPSLDILLACDNPDGPPVPVHLMAGDAQDYALFELRIATANGVIDIEDSGFSLRERRPAPSRIYDGYRQLASGDCRETGLKRAALHAVDDFHGVVTRGTPCRSDGDSALHTLAVCSQAVRAAAQQASCSKGRIQP